MYFYISGKVIANNLYTLLQPREPIVQSICWLLDH
jgi:hypothetical protein